jgi:hypothetical protein
MNTLLELNNRYENAIISDERSSSITFDRSVGSNQTINFFESQTPNLIPGIYIVEIVDYAAVNCTATFTITGSTGATLDFGTLPNAVTVTNPSAGVYQVNNIRSNYDWLVVATAKLTVSPDFFGDYSIAVQINYTGGSKNYTVSGTVTNLAEWTTPITDFWYQTGIGNNITGNPTLVDVNNPVATWVVTVTPSDTSLVTTILTNGTGGTASFNGTTKVLTINGTNAQINSHLSTLNITTPSTARSHFTVQYRATHLTLGYSDVVFQNIRAQVIRYLTDIAFDALYNEDEVLSNFGEITPRITDIEYTGTGSYTVTLTPSTAAAIDTLSAPNGSGTASFNTITKVLTITGTKAQVNERLSYVLINTASDYDQTFIITYAVTTPLGFTASKEQDFFIVGTHAEISNMSIARSYAYNTTALLFPTTVPQITDLDPDVTTYTISLTSNRGQFSAPETTTSANWTYTGSRTAINNLFGQISFIPTTNEFRSETVTYTQVKAGVTQVSTGFTLTGPGIRFDRTTPDNQTVNSTEGGTWTQPLGIEVIGVEDAVTYTIDLNSAGGAATLTWANLPSGVTASIPSANVYRLSNITNINQWNLIKQPTIRMNNTYVGNFTYSATIGWRTNTVSWNTTAAVSDVALMTTPTASLSFFAGQSLTITGFPQLIDQGSQSLSYTVTLTPSVVNRVNTISAGGTGGTVSFNSSTKVLTISGTLSQCNSRLANLSILTTSTAEQSFVITYEATSSAGETQTRVQTLLKDADFTFISLGNQAVTVIEGQEHTVVPGYSISFLNTSYTRLRYFIDVSNIPGAQVIWDTVPSGCTVTNPTTGIYQITGISTSAIWEAVRSPRVTLRNDISGIYSYIATLTDDVISNAWTTSLTVTAVALITTAINATYYSGTTQSLTGTPVLQDQGNQTPTYTVFVTPNKTASISTMTTAGSGGTTAFNPASKTLTISGTLSQVNSHLNSISLNSVTGQDLTYNFGYSASNNANSESGSTLQTMNSNNFTVLNAVRSVASFTSSVETAVSGGPLINSSESGTYTLQVYAVPATAAQKVTFVDPEYVWSSLNNLSIGTNGGWIKSAGSYLIASNGGTSVRLYSVTSSGASLLETYNFGFTVTEANTTVSFLDPEIEITAGNSANRQVIKKRYINADTFTQTFTNNFSSLSRHLRTSLMTIFDPNRNAHRLASLNVSTQLYNEDTSTYYTEAGTQITPLKISLTYSGRRTGYAIGEGEIVGSLISTGLRLIRFSPVQAGLILFANPTDFAISEDGTVIVLSSNTDKTVKIYYKALDDFGLTYTLATTITGTETSFGNNVAVSSDGTNVAIGGKYFYKRFGNTWLQRNTIDSASTAGEPVFIDTIGSDVYVSFLSGTTLKTYKNTDASWNATTKIATRSGTKELINAVIDGVLVTPASGQNSGFEIYYTVTTPSGATSTRNQNINKV